MALFTTINDLREKSNIMSDNRNKFLNKDTFDAIVSGMNAALTETESAKDTATAQAGIATTKAGEASDSATASATSATASDTAKTASETARDESVAAKDTAETQAGIATTKATEAGTSATASANSATASDTAKTASETARDESVTAKTASETARDKSQEWATNPEDTPVETDPNQYSSLHHAAKAEADRVLAQTAATDAGNAKDIAEAYANYSGVWSSLTGALNIPSSVFHNDTFWMLLGDIADVTASEPSGANSDWEPIGASVTSVNGKTGEVVIEIADIDGLSTSLDGKVAKTDFDNADAEATFADTDNFLKSVSGVLKRFTWANLKAAILDFLGIETGTWTPFYEPNSGSFNTITYGERIGEYIKIWNHVITFASIRTNEVDIGTASGNLYVKGFPFTIADVSGTFYTGTVVPGIWGNQKPVFVRGRANNTDAVLNTSNGTAVSPISVGDMVTGEIPSRNRAEFTLIYRIEE